MNLKEQQYVCTLAKCQTISRASEELYISQPALSVYISNLEKYLGVKLFERTGKSFLLTYAGEEYVKRAEKMLEMKREFEEIVNAVKQRYQGRLRLGIQTRRSAYIDPLLVSRFVGRYPDVELVIRDGVQSDLIEMYEKNEIDLLFGVHMDQLRESENIPIADEYVLLAVPRDHPAAKHAYVREGDLYPHIDLEHFDNETFILPQKNQNLRHIADNILETAQICPSRLFEIRSFEAAMEIVSQGLGIGFNRSGYAAFMKNPGVRYYLIGERTISYPLVVSYRKGKEITPYMEYMIELLKDITLSHQTVIN